MNLQDLRKSPLFQGLSDEELKQLTDMAESVSLRKTDGEVLRIPQEAFEELLSSSTTAAMAVLHWVMARLTQNESLLHQQEKMAALGTMSAGLAHELNNPAAAAQRSASQLRETESRWLGLTHQIERGAVQENQTDWFNDFMQEASRRFESPLKLDALQRIDLVDQLQACGWAQVV